MHTFKGSISDFLRDDVFGVRRIVGFYNLWYQNREQPKSFQVVRYETMHVDPYSVLFEVITQLGDGNPDAQAVRGAVEYGAFENMKRMERKGEFRDPMMRPGEKNGGESFKVRQGKIGGYRDYMSADDIDFVEGVVREMSLPGWRLVLCARREPARIGRDCMSNPRSPGLDR